MGAVTVIYGHWSDNLGVCGDRVPIELKSNVRIMQDCGNRRNHYVVIEVCRRNQVRVRTQAGEN